MTTPWTRTSRLRSDIARGLRTLRDDPALLRMKLQQRWHRDNGHDQPTEAKPRPRVAAIDQSLSTVADELRRRAFQKGIVYGDAEFRDSLRAVAPEMQWEWVSHRGRDLLSGATLPTTMDWTGNEVLVVGGGDVKTAYLNALRWMDRSGVVRPVLWVGENFEYCGSTLPIPSSIEAVDIYLFQHFSDFFPIKDPLLTRVTARDEVNRHEQYLLLHPQQTVHFALDTLLPDRHGAAVVEVKTTHPALTGNRHPRWRVWADLSWKGSLTSLHGAHDYGPDHVCESRIPLSECRSGTMAITLPNYDGSLASSALDVRVTHGPKKDSFSRNPSLAVEEFSFPVDAAADGVGQTLGYRYQGYGTSYWFSFEHLRDGQGHSLSGNHEINIAQIEHRPPLDADKRRLLERLEAQGFLFHPHALPLFDPGCDLEFGFSFEWANPRISQFVIALIDSEGQLVDRVHTTLPDAGYHHASDLTAPFQTGGRRPGIAVISPDWKAMDADPQGMNVAGHLVIRNRTTGDRDVTEFQSCWRNLNASIDGFPHWLNPAKGVVGRTSVIGHVRRSAGLRTGLLAINASGHLNHSAEARVKLRLHDPCGESRTAITRIPAFTGTLVWMDELFDDLPSFLSDGYGTCLINSADADINCQFVTASRDGSVSLQHLWGY